MANIMLGFAILFSFLALLLVCLGFATDSWVNTTVDRENLKTVILASTANEDPNAFTRQRGIFKVCYDGSETFFLDNNPDVVSGNCLWVTGLLLNSDENTIDYPDEYDWRNHLIRAQIAATVMGMIALAAGVIISSVGCWELSPRGFRLAGLVVFIGAFLVACGMGCFHGYDYLEREKIDVAQQGVFPLYYTNAVFLKDNSKVFYGWSYIISWVGMGLAAVSGILLLCTAYNIQWDDDFNKYSEKKLQRKAMRDREFARGPKAPPPVYGPSPIYAPPPVYAATPVPSAIGYQPPPVYGTLPAGPPPVVEVPVEVPVAVPVEPPPVLHVLDDDGGYGGGYDSGAGYGYDAYSAYGGQAPMFGPAPYGEMDRYWM